MKTGKGIPQPANLQTCKCQSGPKQKCTGVVRQPSRSVAEFGVFAWLDEHPPHPPPHSSFSLSFLVGLDCQLCQWGRDVSGKLHAHGQLKKRGREVLLSPAGETGSGTKWTQSGEHPAPRPPCLLPITRGGGGNEAPAPGESEHSLLQ